jgi:hypothetical protein
MLSRLYIWDILVHVIPMTSDEKLRGPATKWGLQKSWRHVATLCKEGAV